MGAAGSAWLRHQTTCGKCKTSAVLESLCAEGLRLHADADQDRRPRTPRAELDGQLSLLEQLSQPRIAGHDVPDDGRHPDGCTCQFCQEDEREERARDDEADA